VSSPAAEERRNVIVGGLVLLAAVAAMVLVNINSSRQSAKAGYPLIARFRKAEGVTIGTEVRLSGMAVGKIIDQILDDKFRAVLTLQLDRSVKLPADSNAAIQTDSLLGDKFIALQPGGDDKTLNPGQEISYTQDSLAVRDLLDMIIAQAESVHGSEKQ
jgi:phospholipid/cholesterol/gamma-HCH transport system substrate-binding protein